jgi:hypothetical protein
MKQFAESFPLESDSSGETKPVEKSDTNVFPFKPKEQAKAEGGNRQSYEKYKVSGGRLSPEEYRNVLARFADGKENPSASLSSAHANSMARAAGITLTSEAVSLYGKLRAEQPDPEKEHYSEMSDQQLLAEALRISGDTRSLTAFMEKYPHIFH